MSTVRVYADGVFDLFHHGHGRVLEQAKKLFGKVHLIAGVHDDEVVHSMKGVTVMTYEERMEAVRHCRWVDEVVGNAPWRIDEAFLELHRIDVVAHDGAPYPAAGTSDLYEVPKRMGIFIATARTPNISTSMLIQRILDDAEVYADRNSGRVGDMRRDREGVGI